MAGTAFWFWLINCYPPDGYNDVAPIPAACPLGFPVSAYKLFLSIFFIELGWTIYFFCCFTFPSHLIFILVKVFKYLFWKRKNSHKNFLNWQNLTIWRSKTSTTTSISEYLILPGCSLITDTWNNDVLTCNSISTSMPKIWNKKIRIYSGFCFSDHILFTAAA